MNLKENIEGLFQNHLETSSIELSNEFHSILEKYGFILNHLHFSTFSKLFRD